MTVKINIEEYVEKLDVLSDIYNDLTNKKYANKKERDIAKLKMKLVKKEMLLLNYLIGKEINTF